jgi:hypothetical protein
MRRWFFRGATTYGAHCSGHTRRIFSVRPHEPFGYCKEQHHKTVTNGVRGKVGQPPYASDSNLGFSVKERAFGAFDSLVPAFLNIGNFGGQLTFYTFPVSLIKKHYDQTSSWEKVRFGKNHNLEEYKHAESFERIAGALGIRYPARNSLS